MSTEELPAAHKSENTDMSDQSSDIEIEILDIEEGEYEPIWKKPKISRKSCLSNIQEETSKKRPYLQKYKKDWENIPAFKLWLSQSVQGNNYFYCKFCKNDNKCGKTEIEKHMISKKHVRNSKELQLRVQRKFNCSGLLCPVFTPFESSGDRDINYSIIPTYAKYLHNMGIKGVLLNDVLGEGMSLTQDERMKVTEEWVKSCDSTKMHVMVQVGGAPLKVVQALARHAEKKKVSSIVVLPDVYNRPENHYDLMRYLKIVGDSANTLPLLYYHNPKYTNVNIDMTQFLSDVIGEIRSFVGIIFSSNDLNEAVSALTVNEDKFSVFMGTDEIILGAFSSGFNSLVGNTLNILPKMAQSILESVQTGNVKEARQSQALLKNVIESISRQGQYVPAMKVAMNILTPIKVGCVREPLVPIWEDKIRKMKAELQQLNIVN